MEINDRKIIVSVRGCVLKDGKNLELFSPVDIPVNRKAKQRVADDIEKGDNVKHNDFDELSKNIEMQNKAISDYLENNAEKEEEKDDLEERGNEPLRW